MVNRQDQLRLWASKVQFKNWTIHIGQVADRDYLQISFEATDRFTGVFETQLCREWLLDVDVDESSFIRTVHCAIIQASMHEIDEEFKYDGARLFNPHMNFKNLATAINNKLIGIVLK